MPAPPLTSPSQLHAAAERTPPGAAAAAAAGPVAVAGAAGAASPASGIAASRADVAITPGLPAGRSLARLCVAVVLCIWVSFILVARGSARGTLTPWDIAWLRFLFSGLVVLPLAWRFRRALLGGLTAEVNGLRRHAAGAPPTTVAVRRALALGLSGGIGYCLLAYSGFFLAPVSHAAVLLPGSLPLWSALGAWWLLGERPTASRWAGLALIVAGGVAVAGASLREAFGGLGTWRGDLLFAAASMSWALYGVLCRRWRVGALHATAAIATVALVLAVPAGAVGWAIGAVPSGLAAASWREIGFQAVYQGGLAMLVAGVAFTQVVAHYGPVRTTMFTALVPPLAALAAVPVLGEPLAASALLGLAGVTLGLLVGAGVVGWPGRKAAGTAGAAGAAP
ncbi:MAG: DMT family transporter [Rubrivivax sp.]|nr:DMT family transporter [Rubrivivax sp.]